MRVAVGFEQVGPGQVSCSYTALGFAFSAQAVTASAAHGRGGYVDFAEHRRDLFSGTAFAAQVECFAASLLRRQTFTRRLLGRRRASDGKSARNREHEGDDQRNREEL